MAELEAMEESLMTRTPRTKKGIKIFEKKFKKYQIQDKSGGDHLNMRAVFLHVLGDAVGSVIVIATALVSWLVEGYDWLKLYMDPSLRSAICWYLLKSKKKFYTFIVSSWYA